MADEPQVEETETEETETEETPEVEVASEAEPEIQVPDTPVPVVGAAADPDAAPPAITVVRVDNFTRRSDEDALEGAMCKVVSGPHAGLRGTFVSAVVVDQETKWPEVILVRARDHAGDDDLVTVNYADVRPDGYRERKDA